MSNSHLEPQRKKQGLGRGLGSLLGNAPLESNTPKTQIEEMPAKNVAVAAPTANIPPESRLWQVPVEKLTPSQFQPRKSFEKEKLQELADSIKQNGILQPIVARKLNSGKFEIIAGERRWRAAQMAGHHEVPVLLKTLSNKETLELAIIENIQRQDLNAIEEAEAYQRLMQEFNLTQQQVSEKVGKERATVANALRLLALAPAVRQLLVDGKISAGHAKVLVSIADQKEQLQLATKTINLHLSVRQLEKLSQNKKAESTDEKSITMADKLASALCAELQKALGTKVSIEYKDGKGKLSIQFYSDDELTEIAEKLKS